MEMEEIMMDFIMGLPRSRSENDAIWVIIDRLTKSAHFFPIKKTQNIKNLAQFYVNFIVKLHSVPRSIISDRDIRFTSRVW